jgi:hypothetical protein
MGRYITVEKYVDIEIDLEDLDDDDLVSELERRQINGTLEQSLTFEATTLLTTIFNKRRAGTDYQTELDELIYQGIGRIL